MERKLSYLIYAVIFLVIGGVTALLMTQDYSDFVEQAPAAAKNAVNAELNRHN